MILSDRDIRRRLEKGDIVIEPMEDPELQIQPASVDLRLGSEFLEFNNMRYGCIHPNRKEEVQSYTTSTKFLKKSKKTQTDLQSFDERTKQVVPSDEEYVLHQDEFVLGTTMERVEIPPDLIAHVEGRSSLGRLAILVHATAGVVDPGFRGQITLELSNLGKAPVALQPGMRISQLTFTQLSSEAERPYGEARGSKYQGQTGPQSSRIEGDKEFGGDQ